MKWLKISPKAIDLDDGQLWQVSNKRSSGYERVSKHVPERLYRTHDRGYVGNGCQGNDLEAG